MEDQASWKSHTFTLLVFTGIVVLSSIFFILGMLVGRTQGQKIAFAAAGNAAAKADSKLIPKEESKPDLTFYDSVKEPNSPDLDQPSSAKIPPVVPDAPKVTEPEPPKASLEKAPAPAPENVLNYQIGAVRKSGDADKLLEQLKKKGFRGFILGPAADDGNPFFRVQVGPFADILEADAAKKRLERAGYKPILKK
jgi:cell division septation protein DedD